MIDRLYLISGMGADDMIFRNLVFDGIATTFIPWQKVSNDETLSDYVRRLSAVIDQNEDFGICGVSLGGIAAQEMTRFVDPKLLILISTIKSHDELPPVLRVAANARLQRIFPEQFYKWAAMRSGAVIGLQDEHDKTLFQKMLDQYGDDYYKWCINAVAEWRGVHHDVPYLHLHGDQDVVFPAAHISNAIIIQGGNHFMVVNRAEEISRRIKSFLAEYNA